MWYRVFRLDNEGAPKNPSKRLHLPNAVIEIEERMIERGEKLEWRFRRRAKGAGWSKYRPPSETATVIQTRLKARQDNDMPDAYVVQSNQGGKLLVRELLVPKFEHGHAELPSSAGTWSPKIQHVYKVAFGSKWEHGEPEFYGAENCRPMNLPGGGPSPWSMHSNWPPVLAIDLGTLESDSPQKFGDEIVARLDEHIPGLVHVTWRNNSLHDDHNHEQDGSNRSGKPRCAA